MGEYRKLWWALIAVLGVTFCVLGWFGREVYRQAPPIPAQVVSADGATLFTAEDILDGQTAWQSVGGMQLGSIWGHGAYQAPDWTADWLHRELSAWLDLAAQQAYGKPYAEVDEDHQALLRQQLKREYRGNQVQGERLVLSERRIEAMAQTAAYYDALFGNDPALQGSRKSFAMKENTLPDATRREQLTRFFFWTAWVAATERPGQEATYSNNWPHEPLIGNQPTAENLMWSIASVILLIAGIGFLVWAWAFLRDHEEDEPVAPAQDPLSLVALTPSQKALGKYLLLVVGVVQLPGAARRRHRPLHGGGPGLLRLRRCRSGSPTRCCAPGTSRARCSGSPPASSPPACSWRRSSTAARTRNCQKLGVDVLFWALVVVVRGLLRRQLPGHRPDHAGRVELLARPPGLRVRRPRSPVADRQVRRRGLLAAADAARHPAGLCRQRRRQEPAGPAVGLGDRHRPVLRRRLRSTASAPTCR